MNSIYPRFPIWHGLFGATFFGGLMWLMWWGLTEALGARPGAPISASIQASMLETFATFFLVFCGAGLGFMASLSDWKTRQMYVAELALDKALKDADLHKSNYEQLLRQWAEVPESTREWAVRNLVEAPTTAAAPAESSQTSSASPEPSAGPHHMSI